MTVLFSLLWLISLLSPGALIDAFGTVPLGRQPHTSLRLHSTPTTGTNPHQSFSIEPARQPAPSASSGRSSKLLHSTVSDRPIGLRSRYGGYRSSLCEFLVASTKKVMSIAREYWWSFPFALISVPIFSMLVLGAPPHMPAWWPLTRMDYVHHSPQASLVLTTFFSSNLCYLFSGLYLLVGYPLRNTRGFAPLGGLVLGSGAVSTIFHYFQALGSFAIAEALCYVDHGVAISSILYFLHKCGRPRIITSVLSLAGLVTLNMTGPGYAFLHSLWHALSAAAAVFWAHDGLERHGS